MADSIRQHDIVTAKMPGDTMSSVQRYPYSDTSDS